jgi:pimeloyl-ACP methyl ester carboxylesterase
MKNASQTIKGEIEFDRFVIPYRIYGAGRQSLVFVNGLQQSMAMWQSFVRRFSRDYRIVIFDFPDHGRGRISSGPSDVSLEEQTAILDVIVSVTNATGELTICSASWGGVVAAVYAVQHPEKVQRLILASMGTRANANMLDLIKRGFGVAFEDRLQIAETLIATFGRDLPPPMKRRILMQFQHMSEAGLEAFHRHGLFVLRMRDLAAGVDVRNIKCQTIIVHGEKDTIVDAADAALLATQIPNALFRSIPGVGHFLHLENDAILDVYEDILAMPTMSTPASANAAADPSSSPALSI